jgi:group I intron endonuclease
VYTIYAIQNQANGKVYVGQTSKGADCRWRRHKSDAKRLDLRFYRAIKKYGSASFVVEEIAHTDSKECASVLEEVWISAFRANSPEFGYNSTTGGESTAAEGNPFFGRKHTSEARLKMSLARKGNKAWNKGVPFSVASREKMRTAKLGRIGYWRGKNRDLETISKIAASRQRTDISNDVVVGLYQAGLSCQNIVDRLGTVRSTISWRLRQLRISTRPVGFQKQVH